LTGSALGAELTHRPVKFLAEALTPLPPEEIVDKLWLFFYSLAERVLIPDLGGSYPV